MIYPEFILPDGFKQRVGTIYCIGRNYRNHAKEMMAEIPRHPVVFSKGSAAFTQEKVIRLPKGQLVHHELEIVVIIGKSGAEIPEPEAWNYVSGLALGLDLTLREMQAGFKSKGLPWFRSKSFNQSAVITDVQNPDKFRWEQSFWLEINGVRVQEGQSEDMIFSIPQLITDISEFQTLYPGDLIFTGTPEGVGPLHPDTDLVLGLGKNILGRFTTR